MQKEVHCSSMIYNIWKFTILKCPPVGETDEQIIEYSHNGIWPIVKLKKLDLYYESWKNNIKWQKHVAGWYLMVW